RPQTKWLPTPRPNTRPLFLDGGEESLVMTVSARKQNLIERLPDAKLAYRIEEASIATGISRAVLFRRIAEGSLKTKKDGKITLILRDDLNGYLSSLPSGGHSSGCRVRTTRPIG